MNSLWMVGSVLVLVVSTMLTTNSLNAQSQSDRSLIGSVINITNHTNPIGASVEQMIQATSASNATSPSSTSRINWGEVCRNPLIDSLITEPCETLTTPDGYTLTSEGNRVFLVCIGGGVLATILGYPEVTASVAKAARCGEATSQSNNQSIDNTLKGLIGNYTH